MSTSTLIAIIVPIVVVLIAIAAGLWLVSRRRHLRERFGPEYDRTVQDEGGRLAAERELRAREQRHDKLDIKELPAARRSQYAEEWQGVQEHFVDRPEGAVAQADELVARLMRERGYPTDGFGEQVRDLSVEHGSTLEHYRAAHAVNTRSSEGQATTEELRGAMVHYRALFQELLGDQGGR
ncbi:hypothetical protein GCM10010347_31010 [Streptomyces cirratus]|uniref:Secreted protein n=1 Tax=Streptomyces cirratus TaxID=68187 RepID=A0ABQ3EXE0_9ACTN|nr:hypothetical protein [Streptomyces cirratus]GHB58597.1 hypothetical protein GCM10010347_31010 [Streptomyces cirratus]